MRNFKTVICLTLGALYATTATCALAASSSAGEPSIEEIYVTARPIIEENRIDAFGALTTSITDRQIRDLNAVDLASAARRTPGVTISRFNPVGSFGGSEGGAVYIRGFGASRPGSEIKTYIDDVPFYMGVWNHPLLDLLPVNGVDQIDILKGPQPQNVGNNFAAFNLTPKRASAEGTTGNLRLSGGSFGTFIEQADVTGRTDRLDYTVAQGYARSDGHREGADGRLVNVLGRLGYALSDQWSIDGFVLYVDNTASDPGQINLPATKTGRYDTDGVLGAVTLRHDFGDIKGSLKAYASKGNGNALSQPGLDGNTFTMFNLSGVKWREELTPWEGGHLVGGVDFDSVDGKVNFARIAPAPQAVFSAEAQRITSPFVAVSQDVAVGEAWVLTPSAGVRWYSHNAFEDTAAPHAGLQLKRSDFALRATYARGVNYPGLDAAVLSSLIPPLGNTWRTLKPETLDHFETGFNYTLTNTTFDVALFHDKLKNRYIFAFPPAVSAPSFVNLGSYSVKGLEASVQQRLLDNWNAFVGVTLLDPSLSTLPYAPKSSIVLGTTAQFGSWKISADAQYQGRMYVLGESRDGVANSSTVEDFFVANARVGYAMPALGPRGELFIAVENLFDVRYAYRTGYPMPGISAQAGINFSF